MNSFKTSSSSNDRVDPKLVSPSRHSVFIRGFPSNIQMENVRNFFKTEMNENCKIDFFSYSEDRKKLFIALRFETHEKAEELIESFDNKEVLGHNIEVSWFKDLRKARKKLIEEERTGRNHQSRSPVEWNMMSRNQGSYTRNGGYMWAGRFMRNRLGIRGMGNFSRQRDYQRRVFTNRNTGCWRRARLSPNRPRTRRDRSRSNSHSYSRSRSLSHSRSLSYSSKRSYSSYSSKKSQRRSLSVKDVGHDSIHKYRFDRSNSVGSDNTNIKHSSNINGNTNIKHTSNINGNEKGTVKDKSVTKVIELRPHSPIISNTLTNIVHTYSLSLSDSSASSIDFLGKQERLNGKRHKRKTKKKSKKRKLNKKLKESDENSSVDSSIDKKCIKSNVIGNVQTDNNIKVISDSVEIINKDSGDGININNDYPNLSEEDQLKVLSKKEALEKAYKKDCETVASVSKLIISKNPNIEEEILMILKTIFADIGDKYVEELKCFVSSLTDSSIKQTI